LEIAATVPALEVLDMNDERRRSALWKSTARLRRRLMQRAAVALNKGFRAQFKQVIEAIKNVQTTGEIKPAADRAIDRTVKSIEGPLFDIDLKTAPLFAVQSYLSIKRMVGKQKADEQLPDFTSRVRRHIQEQGAEKVRNVQETTKKRIANAIDRTLEEGGSVREIADRILVDTQLAEINYRRSLVIAHTETIRSSNFGSLMGAKDASQLVGLRLDKVWISTRDAATRTIAGGAQFDHLLMDGKAVMLDGIFLVPMASGSSEPLEYPGAPGGSAGNVINCRCTVGYQEAGA
jgi:hypothetical protein